jgi:hypothetical protein
MYSLSDAITVHGIAGQCFQNQQLQRALQQIGSGVRHRFSLP